MSGSTDICTIVCSEFSIVMAQIPMTGSQAANIQYVGISPAAISASANDAAANTRTNRRG